MRAKIAVTIIIIFLCITVQSVFANPIIYHNGLPAPAWQTPPFGTVSDDWPKVGNDFMLESGANVITDIHWWGYYSNPNFTPVDDNFTIQFIEFDPDTNLPKINDVLLEITAPVTRQDSGLNLTNTAQDIVYEYGLDIDPLELTPGVSYLMAIFNDYHVSDSNKWVWGYLEEIPPDGNIYVDYTKDINTDYTTILNLETAFYLTGQSQPIPEPATILLIGSGLAGLFGLRRKFRKV